jgi:membrane protease YdiL (CAAX protease family)
MHTTFIGLRGGWLTFSGISATYATSSTKIAPIALNKNQFGRPQGGHTISGTLSIPPVKDQTSVRRKIFEMALVFLLFIPFPLYFIPGMADGSAPITLQMISYIVLSIPQIGVLAYILHLQKPNWADFGMKRPRWSTVACALIGLGGAILTILLVMLLSALLPEGTRENLLKQTPLKITSPIEIPLMIAFCITVGYREEILFRAYFIPRLGEIGIKPVWAIIGTSLVFGMAHYNQGILGVVTIFAIGAFFGTVFALRKDLHAVAWAHALYNISVFLFSFLIPIGKP